MNLVSKELLAKVEELERHYQGAGAGPDEVYKRMEIKCEGVVFMLRI